MCVYVCMMLYDYAREHFHFEKAKKVHDISLNLLAHMLSQLILQYMACSEDCELLLNGQAQVCS